MLPAIPSASDAEQRDFSRVATGLAGTLFILPDGASHPCSIIDMSSGGARIACRYYAMPESLVILYVEGFGRFDAFVIRSDGAEIGLFFVCREENRGTVQQKLAQYVEQGITSPTRLRRHPRRPANARGHFTRADGHLAACQLLDVSRQGMSVRTASRPPVGEIVNLGGAHGRVARHFEDGIAIQFLMDVKKEPLAT